METRAEHNFRKAEIDIYQRDERMGRSNNQKSNTPSAIPKSSEKAEVSSLERSKYVYEQVNGWIENADNKVSVSCGIFTGAFGVFTFLAERYVKAPANPIINECWHKVYQLSFILSLVAMALAVLLYARAVLPNLKSNGKAKPTQKKFPIFYGDIHSLSFETYQRLMKNGTDKDFNNELTQEIWHNAGICMNKMRWYKKGVIISIVAIGLAAVSFISHFLMYR